MSGMILRATELAHLFLALAVRPGDTVIDATAGQGRDTCFLASLVGPTGLVWAFDIQQQACLACQAALEVAGLDAWTRVIQDDHARLNDYDIAPAAAAIFNLGWLPGSDHTVASGESTVTALIAALDKLKAGGIIVVVAYPGHEAGREETLAVQYWLTTLPVRQSQSMQVSFPGKKQAPLVIVIEKQG